MGKRGAMRPAASVSSAFAKQGENVRPVELVIMSDSIPARCTCTWSARYDPTNPLSPTRWRLKFRHGACPAKLRREHG